MDTVNGIVFLQERFLFIIIFFYAISWIMPHQRLGSTLNTLIGLHTKIENDVPYVWLKSIQPNELRWIIIFF